MAVPLRGVEPVGRERSDEWLRSNPASAPAASLLPRIRAARYTSNRAGATRSARLRFSELDDAEGRDREMSMDTAHEPFLQAWFDESGKKKIGSNS
jgi:hypothetical protein